MKVFRSQGKHLNFYWVFPAEKNLKTKSNFLKFKLFFLPVVDGWLDSYKGCFICTNIFTYTLTHTQSYIHMYLHVRTKIFEEYDDRGVFTTVKPKN